MFSCSKALPAKNGKSYGQHSIHDFTQAVIKIQSCWRAYVVRRTYSLKLMTFTIFGLRHFAAGTIQRYWRGYSVRKVLYEEATCLSIRHPACSCAGATKAATNRRDKLINSLELFVDCAPAPPLPRRTASCCDCCLFESIKVDDKKDPDHNANTSITSLQASASITPPVVQEANPDSTLCSGLSFTIPRILPRPESIQAVCGALCCNRACSVLTLENSQQQKLAVEREYNRFRDWAIRSSQADNHADGEDQNSLSVDSSATSTTGGDSNATDTNIRTPRKSSVVTVLRNSGRAPFCGVIVSNNSEYCDLSFVRPNQPDECIMVESDNFEGLGTCIRRPNCHYCGVRLNDLTNTHNEMVGSNGNSKWLASPKWISSVSRVAGTFDALPWRSSYAMKYCTLRKCLVFLVPKDSLRCSTSILHSIERQGLDPTLRYRYDVSKLNIMERVLRLLIALIIKSGAGTAICDKNLMNDMRALINNYAEEAYSRKYAMSVEFKFLTEAQPGQETRWWCNEHEHDIAFSPTNSNHYVRIVS